MKNFLIAFGFITVSFLGFTSCKKCMDCSYKYTDATTEYTYTYEQYCGSKKNVEGFEDMVKAEAEQKGGTHTCDIIE